MKAAIKTILPAMFFTIFFVLGTQSFAGDIKDSESASHSDAAADYDIVDTYAYPGFKIIQFNLAVLSHYSYMLISEKHALVVDPGRDIFKCLEIAQKENSKIKGILLTHSHADFVAGHMELAKRAGCPVFISTRDDASYPHTPLKDGSTLSTALKTKGMQNFGWD